MKTGSILVAFIMLPLILSLPPMKRRWALALPVTRAPKSASERMRVTVFVRQVPPSAIVIVPRMMGREMRRIILQRERGIHIPSAFPPGGAGPLPATPFSFTSTYQLASWPLEFLRVIPTMVFAFSMASLRSSSLFWRVALMMSNAAEEGKASARNTV